MNWRTVAANLRHARKAAGLTQRQLAERASIEQGQISKYESGKVRPDLGSLVRIALTLQQSIDTLLRRGDEDYDALIGVERRTSKPPALTVRERQYLKAFRELGQIDPDFQRTIEGLTVQRLREARRIRKHSHTTRHGV